MFDQNPFTEEGRTRFRNFGRRLAGYLILSLLLGSLAGFGVFRMWTRANLAPLQKLYLRQYGLGSLKAMASERGASRYTLLTCQTSDSTDGRAAIGGVNDAQVHPIRDAEGRPIRNENGFVFVWNSPRFERQGELSWRKMTVNDRRMIALLREHNYEGTSFFGLLLPSVIAGLIVSAGGIVGLILLDQRINRKYEEGRFLRGTRLVQPEKFELNASPLGLGLPSLRLKERRFRRFRRRKEAVHWLQIPREEEAAHATLLGDTGTGKSQLIHLFLHQIAARQPEEAVIVYDPAGEFVAAHFSAERGDLILNPLDERFPFWTPAAEVRLRTDRDLIAESFFPAAENQRGTTSEFFIRASRNIFARLLEFNPTPAELIAWLTSEGEIDERVQGTELIHLIDPRAPQQRGGVLGSLSDAGTKLKMLPGREEAAGEISLTRWAEARRGWIFVTSTQDTRAQLRPLHAVFLDLLMKRLMAGDPARGRAHPCWLIVDEAHALGRLPALYLALTEGRKFGLKLILGTQNKHQFEEKYGPSAATMLSAAVLKIVFRCNEPDSARWVSELIGESEWEKPRTGVTASVEDRGRDSLHYSNHIERKPVVSREEIMALPKLHGFWKYQDMVVPFRFEARNWRERAARFLPRPAMLAEQPETLAEAERRPPFEVRDERVMKPFEEEPVNEIAPATAGSNLDLGI
jgi:hypothetical protein